MNVEVISARLTQVFETVLPDASFEVKTDADGGITATVDGGSHHAEISRPCGGGEWWWEVWAMYPETKNVASSQQGCDDFDDAASAAIGILAGAVARERMAVGAA